MTALGLTALGAVAAIGLALGVLALRLSGVHGDLAKVRDALDRASDERDRLREALMIAGRENGILTRRLSDTERRHAERLLYLRGQLDQCRDPAIRGAIAIAGVRHLLQSINVADPTDRDNTRLLTDRDPDPDD